MIKFVNAKINLGLNITLRRENGYHDLETIFYPVGLYNGTPENPEPFCDILEITPAETTEFVFTGRAVDCPLEKNLVFKAWNLFHERKPDMHSYRISLEKHLPDGAGLGGGSADASFALLALNEMEKFPFSIDELAGMALKLGADCPFFIYNKPCFASGIGEILEPIPLDLSGWWSLLVKPDIYVSTKDAFANVVPAAPAKCLKNIALCNPEGWNDEMKNDFESSIFPKNEVFSIIKQSLLEKGAAYASMSGSGSTIYGLFPSREAALTASEAFANHFVALCKL